jgi:hypothetical protein
MNNKNINIIWRNIDSSTIDTIHYSCHQGKSYLGVKFSNEYSYIYSDVTLLEVFQMISSDSCGGYFSKNIRSKYPYKHAGKIQTDSPLIKIGISEEGLWGV